MRLFYVTTLLLFTHCVYSQALLNFEAVQLQDKIHISWTMNAGTTCTGLKVQHSEDSLNFITIYEYPGICGNASTTETYTYNHTPKPNTYNYYRLDMGIYGLSEIKKVTFIGYTNNSYVIDYNTSTGLKIYFQNSLNDNYTFEIYNLSGKIIDSKNINSSEIPIPPFALKTGVYVFSLISQQGNSFSGKFVIP